MNMTVTPRVVGAAAAFRRSSDAAGAPGGFEQLLAALPMDLLATSEVAHWLRPALDRVRAYFRADRCALLVADDDGGTDVTSITARGGSWLPRRLDAATFDGLDTRACLSVRIDASGSKVHLLAVHAGAADRGWSHDDAGRLRLVGERLVQLLERRRTAEALARSEARLEHATRELAAAHVEVAQLRRQVQSQRLEVRRDGAHLAAPCGVVARSAAIRRVLALADQVAPTTATVLLTGETGTGKERFATLIHEGSPRQKRAMVRVNCSAIPTALIESELFGREKGAYTGALSKQIGRFEVANGSTLFLDEVGDLPLDVQVKLLRVLQERTIERLGSPRSVDVDVRIIAATNRDLAREVREGRFRSDLYYRLNVFPIEVPPLRDRRDDIPALVVALVEEIGEAMGKRFDGVEKASVDVLRRYDWPGNVRELRNVLERAMILSPGPTLRVEMAAAPALFGNEGAGPGASSRLEDVEREHIVRVLDQAGWRIKGTESASVRLGLKPSTLYFRMKKLGIARR